jgi:hypothetical protein
MILTSGPTASGHNITQYPTSAGWQYTILTRSFYTHPTQWLSSFNARTDAAMSTWTASRGAI